MFNLIIKDFIILKKVLITSVAYGLLFSFTFQSFGNPTTVYVAVTTVVAYMLLTSACAYDDKYKADIILNSLPIKRREIVIAKYISMIFFLAIGLGITFIITSLINASGFGKMNRLMNVQDTMGCAACVILIGACYLPIYFKFGYIKSKYVSVVFMVVAFIIPTAISTAITGGNPPEFLIYLNSLPNLIIGAILLLIILIIVFISMAFSEKIYLNKDM